MEKNRKRGARRDQTARHVRHEARVYHRLSHRGSFSACDCAERPLGRFRKGKALACRCRGKKRGAPKLAGSLHKSAYTYRTTTMRRIWNRRLARAWLAAVPDNEPEEIELPSGPITGRRRNAHTWA